MRRMPIRMTAAEAVDRASCGALTILDVREAAEVATSGRAAGALHVPLGLVGLRCDPSAPDCPSGMACDKPVALYCAAGGRSERAGEILCALGYAEVYNIGGFGDWLAAGGAVER